MAPPALSGSRPLIQFRDYFAQTAGLHDQAVTRPLPKHRTTETQNKRIHTPNIQALNVIRTHNNYSVRASEDSSFVRPRGYCDG
jgi:hypothetical protein